jgi:outer membrane autotransporter protein
VATRRRQITRLTFVPGLALVGGALGSIPGALAQTSFTSFSPPPQGSSTDAAVAATTQAAQRSQANSTATLIQSHVRDVVRGIVRSLQTGEGDSGISGLAAGSGPAKYGTWADVSGSYLQNTAGGSFSFQGWSVTGVAGLDVVLGDSWVAGLSAGYQRADFGVPSLANGTRRNYGPLVGPYVSYIIDPHFSVDGSINYSTLSNDVITLSVPPNLRHFGSKRWTYAVNGDYFQDIGAFSLTGFAGYTYSYEYQRGFTDNSGAQFASATVRYGAWRVGGELSYPFGNFEPYVPVTLEHETTRVVDGTSRTDVVIGVGLRYSLGDAVKLGLLGTSEEVRRNQTDKTIGANIRVSF